MRLEKKNERSIFRRKRRKILPLRLKEKKLCLKKKGTKVDFRKTKQYVK